MPDEEVGRRDRKISLSSLLGTVTDRMNSDKDYCPIIFPFSFGRDNRIRDFSLLRKFLFQTVGKFRFSKYTRKKVFFSS